MFRVTTSVFVLATFLTFANTAHAVCNFDSDCNDSNPCTIDDCTIFLTCSYTNRPNGYACNTDANPATYQVCQSGTCSSTEYCDDSQDNDGDGLTDEHSPTANNTCEGPRGSFETNNWWKREPTWTGDSDGFLDPGDECRFSEDCDEGLCALDGNNEAYCAAQYSCADAGTLDWGYAYVDDCDNGLGMLYCLPAQVDDGDWDTLDDATRPGDGNNLDGEFCRYNTDCAADHCVRKGFLGMCVEDACSLTPPSGCDVADTCTSIPQPLFAETLCMPWELICTANTTADNCTKSGGVWSCP